MKHLLNIERMSIGNREVNSINLRELHGELGSKKDFSNWAKKNLELFDEGVDFVSFAQTVERETGASVRKEYVVILDVAKHISMLQRTDKGRDVRQHFIDFEKQNIMESSYLIGDPIKRAEAWIEEQKRHKAKKALIGSKREATAMATASVATKRAKKLEVLLDESKEWASVKRMEIMMGNHFDWRRLKETSASMNISPRKIFDANYGEVNAYHSSVWMAVYEVEVA